MFLIFCIYAIVAVEEFRDIGSTGTYPYDYLPSDIIVDNETVDKISSITNRGHPYGYEYWGTFSRALYTLFQVRRPR